MSTGEKFLAAVASVVVALGAAFAGYAVLTYLAVLGMLIAMGSIESEWHRRQ